MNCPNCNSEVDQEDLYVCYVHDENYCCWCSVDRHGSCCQSQADGMVCQVGIDDGIPF